MKKEGSLNREVSWKRLAVSTRKAVRSGEQLQKAGQLENHDSYKRRAVIKRKRGPVLSRGRKGQG